MLYLVDGYNVTHRDPTLRRCRFSNRERRSWRGCASAAAIFSAAGESWWCSTARAGRGCRPVAACRSSSCTRTEGSADNEIVRIAAKATGSVVNSG